MEGGSPAEGGTQLFQKGTPPRVGGALSKGLFRVSGIEKSGVKAAQTMVSVGYQVRQWRGCEWSVRSPGERTPTPPPPPCCCCNICRTTAPTAHIFPFAISACSRHACAAPRRYCNP